MANKHIRHNEFAIMTTGNNHKDSEIHFSIIISSLKLVYSKPPILELMLDWAHVMCCEVSIATVGIAEVLLLIT